MADPQGRLLEVNEAYCRMKRPTARKELLRDARSDLEAVEAAEQTPPASRRIMARGEDRSSRGTGAKTAARSTSKSASSNSPGGNGRLIAFLRDVSARKLVEEALRERVKEMNCLYSVGDLI